MNWEDQVFLLVRSAVALVAVLAPGLALAAWLGKADEPGRWLLYGLGLSHVVMSGLITAVGALRWYDATWGDLVFAAIGAATLGVMLWWCLTHRALFTRERCRDLALAVVPLLLLLVVLRGKLDEAFNPDGVHAYETARRLYHSGLPFWGHEFGPISGFPGVTSVLFAYPAAWFLALGLDTAGPRLAFFLQLLGVYAGLLALVRAGAQRPVTVLEQAGIWCGLATYAVVMAFSATYSPYSADLAMPGAQDTQLLAMFLGFLVAWTRGDRGFAALFVVLTFLSLPNGVLLIAGWIVLALLLERPRPWRSARLAAATLACCLVAGALVPWMLGALGAPEPGGEYEALYKRFQFLLFDDWRRLVWLLVPCGLLPGIALFWWPRRDRFATALALLTLGYFALFYVQAYIALHHFVPVFVLPLVVFWRTVAQGPPRVLLPLAACAAGIACAWWSLPADRRPHEASRQVGRLIADRRFSTAEGIDRPIRPERYLSAQALHKLFPDEREERVPRESYGGSDFAWQAYSGSQGPHRYVLQWEQSPAPPGSLLLGTAHGAALYALDPAFPDEDRRLRPPTSADNPLYVIDRDILFKRAHRRPGSRVIDLVQVLKRLGLVR